MPRLSDTEQVILTAIDTVPTRERSRSKADPRAYGAAVAKLIKKGMLELGGPAREGEFAREGQKVVIAKSETDSIRVGPETEQRRFRDGTKQALMIELLRRPQGATLGEMVEATGWQTHTVRGAMAGSLKEKLGLNLTSEKDELRGRVYKIAS
jgi:hypothetical protein